MSTSGNFYDMFSGAWSNIDSTAEVTDGFGDNPTVVVNNGIDIEWYVKKNFNGDTPECITDQIYDAVIDPFKVTYYLAVFDFDKMEELVSETLSDFADWFGTFICTSTVEVLGTKCGNALLQRLKDYRDETMTGEDGMEMLRYYAVFGPKIVQRVSEDPDRLAIYKYIYSDYISRLEGMIERHEKLEIFILYFQLIDDMLARYEINPGKRYRKCQMKLLA